MRNLQRIRGHASLLSNSSAAGQPAVPLAPSPPTTICLLKRRELSTATRRDAFPAPSTARLLARRPTVVRSVLLGPSDSRRLVSTRPSPPRRRGIPPFGQYPQSITEVEAADALGGATYTPAASGENLEEVGGLDDWWEDPHHWSESYDPPRPFGPTEAAGDKARLLAGLVRQALLEATAVRAMGKPKDLLKTWAVMSEEAAHGAEGPAAVAGQGDDGLRELAARLLKRLPKNVTMARDSAGAIANAAKLLGGDGQAWTEISLDEDAAFRFAVGCAQTVQWVEACVVLTDAAPGGETDPAAHRTSHPGPQAHGRRHGGRLARCYDSAPEASEARTGTAGQGGGASGAEPEDLQQESDADRQGEDGWALEGDGGRATEEGLAGDGHGTLQQECGGEMDHGQVLKGRRLVAGR